MHDNNFLNKVKTLAGNYFSLTPYIISQQDAEASIREGVSFRGTNLIILILAIFVASLGLNTNSTAVIIGAMLISPLMGPIIGIGLGIGVMDFDLVKRSCRNLIIAALFSVLTSCLYFLISPGCRRSQRTACAHLPYHLRRADRTFRRRRRNRGNLQ